MVTHPSTNLYFCCLTCNRLHSTILPLSYWYLSKSKVQARSSSSESEAMLGIVDDTEEKSQKDQIVTASKPSKPLLT